MTTPAPYPPYNGTEPCQKGDPERFYPGQGDTARSVKEECQDCHIREQCLDYALTHAVSGIWGGMSDTDRRGLRKERGIQPVNLEADVLDTDLIIRAHLRGMSIPVIAQIVERNEQSVNMVLKKWRRRQHALEKQAS